ncbi:hypothetical protein K461DRAFT_280813 [Myriangium duriaei CBS 260.36]|uniref:Uncharacterized protein n=1 Tax=Myriangium duriaei CBS 260.36 TaxID=1168546 RepID=A0A9P4IW89_9PEZI|nr:hypothetical protein K461DRAFT_280813 [Myriangium duriaei CBS 260.36]
MKPLHFCSLLSLASAGLVRESDYSQFPTIHQNRIDEPPPYCRSNGYRFWWYDCAGITMREMLFENECCVTIEHSHGRPTQELDDKKRQDLQAALLEQGRLPNDYDTAKKGGWRCSFYGSHRWPEDARYIRAWIGGLDKFTEDDKVKVGDVMFTAKSDGISCWYRDWNKGKGTAG